MWGLSFFIGGLRLPNHVPVALGPQYDDGLPFLHPRPFCHHVDPLAVVGFLDSLTHPIRFGSSLAGAGSGCRGALA